MFKTSYDFNRAYIKFINRLNNTIPNIAQGGCGEFALIIKEKLSEMQGVEVVGIKCMGSFGSSVVDIGKQTNLDIFVKKHGDWCHFFIEVRINKETLWVDSSEVSEPDYYTNKDCVYDGLFCEHELVSMCAEDVWNRKFRRSNIVKLKEFVQNYQFV